MPIVGRYDESITNERKPGSCGSCQRGFLFKYLKAPPNLNHVSSVGTRYYFACKCPAGNWVNMKSKVAQFNYNIHSSYFTDQEISHNDAIETMSIYKKKFGI